MLSISEDREHDVVHIFPAFAFSERKDLALDLRSG